MSVGTFLEGRGEGDWEAAFLACFFWGGKGDGQVFCLACFFGGEGMGKLPVSHPFFLGGGGWGRCLSHIPRIKAICTSPLRTKRWSDYIQATFLPLKVSYRGSFNVFFLSL